LIRSLSINLSVLSKVFERRSWISPTVSRGTGVIIKINSALRACGLKLIRELHDRGLRVMADLKLNDIYETMSIDASVLAPYKPEFLTVMCSAEIDGIEIVRRALAGITEVLGVTVLTSFDEEECQSVYGCSAKAGVLRFARMARLAGLAGLILSPQEAEMLTKHPELSALSLNTPGIRPAWALVKGDDQARVMTPAKAIVAGAERIVVGRPILNAAPNDEGFPASPLEAVKRTLEEIDEGLKARAKK
jgi:orotidine-5'-phosphate decarboxylase